MADQASRRAAREQAFALLFELSFHADAAIETLLANAVDADRGEPLQPDPFAVRLAETAAANLEQLDGEIAKRLKNWKLSRIPRASHALLRLALCEMLFFDEIPVGASINEAVELGKRYGDEEAPRFINGVLGAVARNAAVESAAAETAAAEEKTDANPGD